MGRAGPKPISQSPQAHLRMYSFIPHSRHRNSRILISDSTLKTEITDRNRTSKIKHTKSKMVCLMCLLPLFLIPIVNALPLLFDLIMVRARVYGLLGWEYRKPERVPPACTYKPAAAKGNKVNPKLDTSNLKDGEEAAPLKDMQSDSVGANSDKID
ncbi:hypothetical protein AKJ16_DCAP16470 [Drosera capensis]